jgi:hypothetical protein
MHIIKVFAIIILSSILAIPASAQLSRNRIKSNNKAMSKFRGKKNTFSKQKKYYSFGISVNSMNYLGDIAPKASWGSTKVGNTRPGVTLSFAHRYGPRYSVLAGLSYGRLQSDDFKVSDPGSEESKYRYTRNASFRNDIWELSAVAVVDIIKNEASYLSRATLVPYVFAGIAGFYHNPKAKVPDNYVLDAGGGSTPLTEAGTWVALQPLGTEGQHATDLVDTDANFGIKPYSLWQISIPIGVGIRYRLADALDLSFDFSVRVLFTDYIDDVSKNYVDLDVLDSDLARAMSDRSRDALSATGEPRDISGLGTQVYTGRNGNDYEVITGYGSEQGDNFRGSPKYNDMYYVASFKIAYIIGGKFRRAKFR